MLYRGLSMLTYLISICKISQVLRLIVYHCCLLRGIYLDVIVASFFSNGNVIVCSCVLHVLH